jgi:hypothetical protein
MQKEEVLVNSEILPDGIIKQRIQRMAEDIEPYAWNFFKTRTMQWDLPLHTFYNEKCTESLKIAKRLIAAGWCPGPIGEKPVLDKYFKT